ncbi:MAG: HD domain-containing protein [Firmicutes bacterium]|nr:HD domain-containing protein [Bacillota bacterium]
MRKYGPHIVAEHRLAIRIQAPRVVDTCATLERRVGTVTSAGKFSKVAAGKSNSKWNDCLRRYGELYQRENDPRSEFNRDYNRILHCTAYRRLKHKTQVFFATGHDHVCTRMEHVNHVSAVSYTIAKCLGLNTELTSAIAIGHDLGHTPFGHRGEYILKSLYKEFLSEDFWHERNSLRFVDKLETLEDPNGKDRNLCLTYAVRDGLVCHCGEVDDRVLSPRDEVRDLYGIVEAGREAPFTWEGCVVKIADKIAFLGRDIEDATVMGIISREERNDLVQDIKRQLEIKLAEVNNTSLMQHLILDLCKSSEPEEGLMFSEQSVELIRVIKRFSEERIYNSPRLTCFKEFASLVIESIFDTLRDFYSPRPMDIIKGLKNAVPYYPSLAGTFLDWMIKYSDVDLETRGKRGHANDVVYAIDRENDYVQSIVDYISGMTDTFALKAFRELTSFDYAPELWEVRRGIARGTT